MFLCVDQDRERLRKFLPWVDGTRTLEDEKAYIQMTLEKWESGQLFDYSIYLKADGAYLGNVGIHSIFWEHDRCEIGYWILGRFEGQGYMSEAVRALEATCFETGFHRVEIRCSSKNVRSASIPERLGYRHEGTLREDSLEKGVRRDTLVFAKLRTDPACG